MAENIYSDRITSFSPQLQSPRRHGTCFPTVVSLQAELRKQRKHLLGSYISLRAMVYDGAGPNDLKINELCNLLSKNTFLFWNHSTDTAREFSYLFYDVVIRSIAYGKVGGESIDDIIRLAECLVDSKEIFETVIKQLLSNDRIGDLFRLTEEYEESFFTPAFTNAVLCAVSVFLGALKAPADNHEEGNV